VPHGIQKLLAGTAMVLAPNIEKKMGECQKFCVWGFCEGEFPFWHIETEASSARSTTLLGRTERSSPEAAQRRAAGAGLDGERAAQAIILRAAMSIAAVIAPFLESARRTG
jgi:hypothetical protein